MLILKFIGDVFRGKVFPEFKFKILTGSKKYFFRCAFCSFFVLKWKNRCAGIDGAAVLLFARFATMIQKGSVAEAGREQNPASIIILLHLC